MAPWDEMTYVLQWKETSFGVTSDVGTPSIAANAMRVGIIFSTANNASSINVSTKQSPSATTGFNIQSGLQLVLSHRDFPGLPQQAWFLNVTGTARLTVLEVIMRSWPIESDVDPAIRDWLEDNAEEQPPIRPKPVTKPARNSGAVNFANSPALVSPLGWYSLDQPRHYDRRRSRFALFRQYLANLLDPQNSRRAYPAGVELH